MTRGGLAFDKLKFDGYILILTVVNLVINQPMRI